MCSTGGSRSPFRRRKIDSFVVGSNNSVALEKLRGIADDRIIMVNLQANEPNLCEHLRKGNVGLTTGWSGDRVHFVLRHGDEVLAELPVPGPGSRDGARPVETDLRGAMHSLLLRPMRWE